MINLEVKLSEVCADFRLNEPLSAHTTWGIGGSARYFAEPATIEEMVALVEVANNEGIPYAVIGAGSNLLVADAGVEGLVIKLGKKFSAISISGGEMVVQAGAYVPCIARKACMHGLSGIEHIIGIPASVGGLVAMNGGSRRQNIGSVIEEVKALSHDGNLRVFNREECGFSYRESRFQNESLRWTAPPKRR